MNLNPVLDRKRPAGDIYGGEPDASGRTPRYFQDGHYFGGDGTYLSSEPGAGRVAGPVAEPVIPPALTAVTEDAEIDELLKDPVAEDLLAMDREVILEMVKQANGPVIVGEGSQRMMAAWLIKHTMARATAAAPAPDLGAQGSLINPEDLNGDGEVELEQRGTIGAADDPAGGSQAS